MNKEELLRIRDDENIEGMEFKDKFKIDYRIYESSIRELKSWYDDGDVDLNAKYQRGFVWTKKQASKFVESIVYGLPIPGIIIVKLEETNKYEILDGKQRLTSIFKYINEDSFDNQKVPFGLSLENKYYNKKKYGQLNSDEQKMILRTRIPVTQIDLSHTDEENIFMTFERINTGGTKLSAQNIRNAVYKSNFLESLINKFSPLFEETKKFTRKDIALGKDIEIILRILATFMIRKDGSVLKNSGSIKSTINDFVSYFYNNEKGNSVSQKNSFRNFNFAYEVNSTVDKLYALVKSLKSEMLDGPNAKIYSALIWESFFVAALELEVVDGHKEISSLANIEFSRGEDSNWYNHTNNWSKINGRIEEVKGAIKTKNK